MQLYDKICHLRAQASFIYDVAISQEKRPDTSLIKVLLDNAISNSSSKEIIEAFRFIEIDSKAHKIRIKELVEKISDNDKHIKQLKDVILQRAKKKGILHEGDYSCTIVDDNFKIR